MIHQTRSLFHSPLAILAPVAGVVEQIVVRGKPADFPQPVESVEAVAGQGLRGDCHFLASPAPRRSGHDLTLIAAEALEALAAEEGIELGHAESRRNVLTRGIDLNALVGTRFRVGEAECYGVELCEPCRKLQRLTKPGVLRGLVHRGGLSADVVAGGTIAAGDSVEPL